jgi:LmbE family N-acetylglucosaminyl deacetylase
VELVGLPDGGLTTARDAVRDAIEAALAPFRPDVVLAPWLGDGHADHRAVAEALAAARHLEPATEVWGYETWTALPATRLVDITDAIEAKQAALAAHETAALAFDVSAGLGLSRWRSIHGLMGRGWAEAFLAGTAADHRELAARWASLDGSPL